MSDPRRRQQTQPGPEQQALLDALAAENAAVYAYGIVGAFSNPDRGDMIAAASAAHRARRDATIDALSAASIVAPEPPAGYTVPFPVTDPTTAVQLAVQAESDTAVAWRSVIERSQSDHTRGTGIDALTETALRLADWRTILGTTPPTVPFPGAPQK
ncbi:ferritin-like domain-containing protein [Antrihabitans cavernicola]|uniref:DUF4439 domain-containing protein n=1 Tax=Antrihabitans cavernicola TaxID=2495913 RepID=A0A5A7SBI7_9NOCA|nr:ferritin-like domain-containing protein [Spelaeibacter cavernicola]KAA0023286.1 DUF4439 domain-containing protein [Spelaeibacter cavernicola]